MIAQEQVPLSVEWVRSIEPVAPMGPGNRSGNRGVYPRTRTPPSPDLIAYFGDAVRCNACKTSKPIDSFPNSNLRDNQRRGSRTSRCRECHAARLRRMPSHHSTRARGNVQLASIDGRTITRSAAIDLGLWSLKRERHVHARAAYARVIIPEKLGPDGTIWPSNAAHPVFSQLPLDGGAAVAPAPAVPQQRSERQPTERAAAIANGQIDLEEAIADSLDKVVATNLDRDPNAPTAKRVSKGAARRAAKALTHEERARLYDEQLARFDLACLNGTARLATADEVAAEYRAQARRKATERKRTRQHSRILPEVDVHFTERDIQQKTAEYLSGPPRFATPDDWDSSLGPFPDKPSLDRVSNPNRSYTGPNTRGTTVKNNSARGRDTIAQHNAYIVREARALGMVHFDEIDVPMHVALLRIPIRFLNTVGKTALLAASVPMPRRTAAQPDSAIPPLASAGESPCSQNASETQPQTQTPALDRRGEELPALTPVQAFPDPPRARSATADHPYQVRQQIPASA